MASHWEPVDTISLCTCVHVKAKVEKSRRNPNAHFLEAEAPLTLHTASGPRSRPGSRPATGLRAGQVPTYPWLPQAERGRPGKPRSRRLGGGRPRSRCAPERNMAEAGGAEAEDAGAGTCSETSRHPGAAGPAAPLGGGGALPRARGGLEG